MKNKNLLPIITCIVILSGCSNYESSKIQTLESESTIKAIIEAEVSSNLVESVAGELLDSFLAGECMAYYMDADMEPFYVTDLPMDEEDALSYSVGDRVDLDNDGEEELILNGAYGGKYLDARDGQVYVLDEGWGTAGTVSYTRFDGQTWIVHSDTMHGGRYIYDFTLYDGSGKSVDTFQLKQEFWDTPELPDGPDTVYTYRDEPITKEEYENLKAQMLEGLE